MHYKSLLNFGKQPRCFDFVNRKKQSDLCYEFSVCQSLISGLVQLENPLPAKDLHPTYSWIRNKEPEDHTNVIAQEIFNNIRGENSKVLFLSHYDTKIHDLVQASIGSRTVLLDPKDDLNILVPSPDQALIQDKINTDTTNILLEKYGQFDIIATRRLLEHAANISIFIDGLSKLLKTGGKIIVEVPDSTKSLLQGDIAMLWEEHIYYFTPESLRLEFALHGYSFCKSINYFYPQEDALIGVFTNNSDIDSPILSSPFGEYALAEVFCNKINKLRIEIKEELILLQKEFGKIVIFGAGHRTIMFINLLNLTGQISFIIDDDDNKNVLCLPGSNIIIKSLDTINNSEIGVCLLSVNIKIEENIKNIVNSKVSKKLEFYSISPDSKNALLAFGKT